MIYRVIENCPITRTTSNMLYPYIDNENDKWYRIYGGFHTGVDLECQSVHSACQGIVLDIGQDLDELYEVTVQYDANQCLRYCHLQSILVKENDLIDEGQWIGDAKDFVHFEYVDTNDSEAIWTFRAGVMTYFKHDPELYADGSEHLPNSSLVNIVNVPSDEVFPEIEFSEAMNEEFSDNRVDEVPNSV